VWIARAVYSLEPRPALFNALLDEAYRERTIVSSNTQHAVVLDRPAAPLRLNGDRMHDPHGTLQLRTPDPMVGCRVPESARGDVIATRLRHRHRHELGSFARVPGSVDERELKLPSLRNHRSRWLAGKRPVRIADNALRS
jgi:hypothetical protein